ncbi:DNA repair RAD52-like protein 1, mitochondrial isoform X1 [Magnolia sinica]|uniref:DNA repair RAD52-like protein 1, mitochondrial isoform X1 n=1 Tax=Magnolia sinica TaxID=86752 RepID=UPI00265ADC80|nr:DNA repair RAD52-like protein 1, mitochondrial isoform X1 [Magnolia sinica]
MAPLKPFFKSSSSLSALSSRVCYSISRSYARSSVSKEKEVEKENFSESASEASEIPTSGISRPLSEILKELNRKVPDAFIKVRVEDGFSMKYVPWHIVNRIMNLHAPEWSGEIRSITYSADGKSVSVVYRVTLYGTDAEIYRESSGTASVDDTGYADPVQKAEAMAFRRACARLGLGLHLYHEDMM